MDRAGGEGFETINVGRGSRADDDAPTAPALPPLDLDEQPEQPGYPPPGVMSPTGPSWRRWATVVAVFAFGLVAGASVWDARSNAVDLATEASQVSLVASYVMPEPEMPGEALRIAVRLHNTGARDVTVLSLHPTGWEASDELATVQATSVPAAGAAEIVTTVRPSCNAPIPEQLEARVRTEAGEQSATIALPPGPGMLDFIHEYTCDGFAAVPYITVDRSVLLSTAEPGTLRMVITARVQSPADIDITAASASTAGFFAVSAALPVSVAGGPQAGVPIELMWHIDDCDETYELGDIAIDLEIRTPDDTTTVEAALPPHAIALLGRFAAEECGA